MAADTFSVKMTLSGSRGVSVRREYGLVFVTFAADDVNAMQLVLEPEEAATLAQLLVPPEA